MPRYAPLFLSWSAHALVGIGLLCALALPTQPVYAEDARTVLPRASVPSKKARKPKRVLAAPKPVEAAPPMVAPVSTTRYEEVELVPVAPPAPTPATDVID